MSNHPEKPFFEDALDLTQQIAKLKDDLKATYASAKEHESIGAAGVKRLRASVKRALMDAEDRKAADDFAAEVDDLCIRLGAYADTELGAAAVRAAQ